jgi:hypothetical protein
MRRGGGGQKTNFFAKDARLFAKDVRFFAQDATE